MPMSDQELAPLQISGTKSTHRVRVTQAGAWTRLQLWGCSDAQGFNSSSLAIEEYVYSVRPRASPERSFRRNGTVDGWY